MTQSQHVVVRVAVIFAITVLLKGDDDLRDFEFSDSKDEMMIAQESRQYQTIVKPPVRIIKPTGITNSHRPQYNLDSIEDLEQLFEPTTKRSIAKDYRPSYKVRSKELMIREAVLRALERRDHVGKFAQILPIVRSMSGSQRVALASLVASQVTTPPGRSPLNLAQVRSMFGNNANTSTELMLPILLDMANLIRRAVRSGKEQREVKQPQILRRSYTEDLTELDDEPFETGPTTTPAPTTTKPRNRRIQTQRRSPVSRNNTTTKQPVTTNNIVNRNQGNDNINKTLSDTKDNTQNITTEHNIENNRTNTSASVAMKIQVSSQSSPSKKMVNVLRSGFDNGTMDLVTDSTNQTIQDLPVPEKLRSLNRYLDRKGNLIRRGSYPPKPSAARRTTAEPTLNPITRRRPPPARKLPSPTPTEQAKCELFTNTLCLHSEDYPTDAIVQSIRRNKAAAGALLADFKDPGEGALDGVTAAQESKYTADHYLVSNRRGDTANRDFASAGEAGFMCPSTVKYARPQRARATSGQWKYIVNTGEHTQTLRLEKCLKPKDSCTYLTDNFKSKCVQVYNYHRLLTWDQQNGLHMDIFKVPTCCSCHIEGYSVAFPPLGQRIHEASSEQFPEDLSSEHGNHAFESVQSSNQRPSVTKSPPFSRNKPLEVFPPFSDTHNLISTSSFSNAKIADNDEFNSGNIPPSSPMDSYGNTYYIDSFNQASSVKNVKRPLATRIPTGLDSVTLPSYLEPPTPSAPGSFSFIKETPSKYKITNSQFKRGAIRPHHRPMRKKISGAPDDLVSSGTTAVEEFSNTHIESLEDFNDDIEEPDTNIANKKLEVSTKPITIAPKLQGAKKQDKSSSTAKPSEQKQGQDKIVNGKRVNYNYHPIIDFFGDEDQEAADNDSIDREDSEATVDAFVPPESEWKPINQPGSRNTQTSIVHRKKHK